MFRAIAFQSRMIRLPMHIHNLLQKIRTARRELLIETGSPPSETEVAERVGVSVNKLRMVQRSSQRIFSSSAALRIKSRSSGFRQSSTT